MHAREGEKRKRPMRQDGQKQQPAVVGIVAEYNPFHNGHLYHLREAIKASGADFTVAVMSGDFLQRGEPAIYDKWIRAEAAVQNGVDVVLELPFAFACNSAEYFAYGAIRLLDQLGCVTHLAFGSECADLERIKAVAFTLVSEAETYKANLKKHLNNGLSYPKARYEALREEPTLDEAVELLREPNNILAVEYVKQIMRQRSSMLPVVIARHKAGYKDKAFRDDMASATAIREALMPQATVPTYARGDTAGRLERIRRVIPKETYDVLEREGAHRIFTADKLFQMIQYKVITMPEHKMAKIFAIGEGLEHKITKEIRGVHSYRQLIKAVVSKRYTETRIQRAMIHLLMDFTQKDMQDIMENIDHCLYGRILGLSQKGRILLADRKKEERGKIPIYTNINRQVQGDSPASRLLQFDIKAADVYHIMAAEDIYAQSDFVKKPYIAKG